jgi:hypothetical protein
MQLVGKVTVTLPGEGIPEQELSLPDKILHRLRKNSHLHFAAGQKSPRLQDNLEQ